MVVRWGYTACLGISTIPNVMHTNVDHSHSFFGEVLLASTKCEVGGYIRENTTTPEMELIVLYILSKQKKEKDKRKIGREGYIGHLIKAAFSVIFECSSVG